MCQDGSYASEHLNGIEIFRSYHAEAPPILGEHEDFLRYCAIGVPREVSVQWL
jgi:hypothetical protein